MLHELNLTRLMDTRLIGVFVFYLLDSSSCFISSRR